MASRDARADPRSSSPDEEIGESAQGSTAPVASAGAETRDRSGGSTPIPLGGTAAPDTGSASEFERLFRIALEAQMRAQVQLAGLAGQTSAAVPTPSQTVPAYDRTFERMRKMGAPEFPGSIDPEEAEAWWGKTIDVLTMLGCEQESRVRYMASLFTRDALEWWKRMQDIYRDRQMSWADFQSEFDHRYRPRHYQEKKRAEFLSLRQGHDQSVVEYEHRFTALAKYAPEIIATEGDRMSRFESGLRPEIRSRLPYRAPDFPTLLEAVIRMEEADAEVKENRKRFFESRGESSRAHKKGRAHHTSAGGSHRGRGHQDSRRPKGASRQRQTHHSAPSGTGRRAEQSTARTPVDAPQCQTCTRTHRGQCWGLDKKGKESIVCFNCGGQGHLSRECPNPRR